MFLVFKRFFDFWCALFSLILLAPILMLVALAVKLSSPGSVFFRQKRLTIGMKEFTILKFRTMYLDFDKYAVGIQIKGNSSAITPVGRFLRKSKLDEMPQLINILCGDMSFVGPRPELPRRLQYYSESDKEIFAIKSGVSSPASVVLAAEEYLMLKVTDPEKFYLDKIMPFKIQLNRNYIRNMSIWLDLKVIFATFLKLLGFSADGLVCSDSKLVAERLKIEEAR